MYLRNSLSSLSNSLHHVTLNSLKMTKNPRLLLSKEFDGYFLGEFRYNFEKDSVQKGLNSISDVPPDTIKIWIHIYLKWPILYEKSMMRGITNGTIENGIFMFFFLSILYHAKLVSNLNLLKLQIRVCFIANWQLHFRLRTAASSLITRIFCCLSCQSFILKLKITYNHRQRLWNLWAIFGPSQKIEIHFQQKRFSHPMSLKYFNLISVPISY